MNYTVADQVRDKDIAKIARSTERIAKALERMIELMEEDLGLNDDEE